MGEGTVHKGVKDLCSLGVSKWPSVVSVTKVEESGQGRLERAGSQAQGAVRVHVRTAIVLETVRGSGPRSSYFLLLFFPRVLSGKWLFVASRQDF